MLQSLDCNAGSTGTAAPVWLCLAAKYGGGFARFRSTLNVLAPRVVLLHARSTRYMLVGIQTDMCGPGCSVTQACSCSLKHHGWLQGVCCGAMCVHTQPTWAHCALNPQQRVDICLLLCRLFRVGQLAGLPALASMHDLGLYLTGGH